MAWTDITRAGYNRRYQRYPGDSSDKEWAIIESFLPAERHGSRPRTTDMRLLFDAILYMAQGGIPWRMLPKDFPSLSTVQRYFYEWRKSGVLSAINFALVQMGREPEGKEPGSIRSSVYGGLAHAILPGHLLNRSGYRIANWFLAATHSVTTRPDFSKLGMAR